MVVFHVEKNEDYTVMSSHHPRNKNLTLKTRGLSSQMLPLPGDWGYTLKELSYINRKSIDAIRTAVWEFEKAGYIRREQGRDTKGKTADMIYTVYEQPILENPVLENPTSDNPVLENLTSNSPTPENPAQLNKGAQRVDLSKRGKIITDGQSTHFTPIPSPTPAPMESEVAVTPPERERTGKDEVVRTYREIILENIEYAYLIQDRSIDHEQLDEIIDLMLETVYTTRKTTRVAGDDYPAKLAKSKYMKLADEHIRFVFDCLRGNTTRVCNIKQYLRATLFNTPSTISNYYTALVAHDMVQLDWGKPKSGLPGYSCGEGESLQREKEDDSMKQSALTFDERTDRYDIRFNLVDCYGGLCCGECLDVIIGGKWRPTRIGTARNWYLVGVRADDPSDSRVRI